MKSEAGRDRLQGARTKLAVILRNALA